MGNLLCGKLLLSLTTALTPLQHTEQMGATRSQGEKYGYVWELEDVRRREKDEP